MITKERLINKSISKYCMEEQDKVENEWQKLYGERYRLIKDIYEKSDIARKIGLLSRLEELTLTLGLKISELPYKSVLSEVPRPDSHEGDQEDTTINKGYLEDVDPRTAKLRKDFKFTLRNLRKKREIRREELASAINIHVRTLIRYENGQLRKPHSNNIKAIATYFDVPLSTFYKE